MTDTRVQIGFIVVALGVLLFAAWCYAFDRNLDRLELKVARLERELADARADTQALAAHLGLEILPAIADDSPEAMAAQDDDPQTQPIEAQPATEPIEAVIDRGHRAITSRTYEGYGTFRFRDQP